MKRTWTKEQIEILKAQYPDGDTKEIYELFPEKTHEAIKSKITALGLTKTKKRLRLTEMQKTRLAEIYSDTRTEDIAAEFGCSICVVYNKAYALGLKKSEAFIAKQALDNFTEDHPGRKTLFKKGHVTHNIGKKITEYMSAEAIENSKATRFKKGQKSLNKKPVGYERVNKYGYIEVKVQDPNIFRFKHHLVYEEHFGPIPPGHNVQFRNRIGTDCTPENLYLISRRDQLLTENGPMAIPEELKPTYKALRKLRNIINKHEQKQESN